MIVLLCILGMLLLFALSILVHEAGHFAAARLLGLRAEVFSLGMGPALWQKTACGTRWKIGCLPIGGYVVLPQLDPAGFLEDAPSTPDSAPPLPPVAPWRKILVALAGPAANILFAFLLACLVTLIGRPAALSEQDAVIGWLDPDSPLAAAGITPGDEILALDAAPTPTWIDLATAAALSPSTNATLTVRRAASAPGTPDLSVTVPLRPSSLGGKTLSGIDSRDLCQVALVEPSSPAAAAGLRPGDLVVAYDGAPVWSRLHLIGLVTASAGAPAVVTVQRGSRTLDYTLAAAWNPDLSRHLIGIRFNSLGDLDFTHRSHPSPFAQMRTHFASILSFLRALATPRTASAAADAVGGPVSIFVMLYLMVRASFSLALWFTGFLNVNLALVNLLPLPVLDGGHILLNLWAWITRRPVPAAVVRWLVNLFGVLLILLFVTLTIRDSTRQLLPALRARFASDAPSQPPAAP